MTSDSKMKLTDLFTAVKEERLDKDQLEGYRNQLSGLYADMQIELSTIEKDGALFMAKDFGEKLSVADRKVMWKATQQGQREIELKKYCLATKEILNSLKSRLYSIY